MKSVVRAMEAAEPIVMHTAKSGAIVLADAPRQPHKRAPSLDRRPCALAAGDRPEPSTGQTSVGGEGVRATVVDVSAERL